MANENCFRKHIVDAIKLNEKRLPLYAKLTNGESLKISKRLIRLEKQMRIPVFFYDRIARKYHKVGIPFLCLDLIDMAETPEFSETFSDGPKPLSEFKIFPAKKAVKEYKKALKHTDGLQRLIKLLEKDLHQLEEIPNFNCLSRHFIESLLRSSRLAIDYDKYAKTNNLKSPMKASLSYIKFHFLGFARAAKIDALAAPIQAKNIPILCNDVPAIPTDISWP